MSITLAEECDVPVGWHPLVQAMLTTTLSMWPSVKFLQIKEKFGMLRTSFEVEEDFHGAVSAYVEHFERASAATCAVCGVVHTTRMHVAKGWISPYCDKHKPKGE